MRLFVVRWLDGTGRRRRRRAWAARSMDLRESVSRAGGALLRVEVARTSFDQGRLRLQLPALDAIGLMDQLAMQLDAEIPLDGAVAALAMESDHPTAQQMMAGIHAYLCRDGDVGRAFGRYPRQFPPHVVEMIEVGHRSGRLAETFRSLARHWEEMEEARAVIRKAMTYPVVAGLIMVGIAGFLLGFVLPAFGRLFAELGVNPPGLTRFYLGVSGAMTNHPVALALGASVLIGVAYALRAHPPLRRWQQRLAARLPGVAPLVQAVSVARLASNLATLVRAGIPTQDALRVCAHSTGNAYYDSAVGRALEVLNRGQTLSAALQRTGAFPGLLTTGLRVGEAANRTLEALDRARDYYARTARTLLQSRLQLLEPLLTLTLGLFVGSVAVSLFYPMITLAMNIRR